jgi:hypothetical protein
MVPSPGDKKPWAANLGISAKAVGLSPIRVPFQLGEETPNPSGVVGVTGAPTLI